MSNYRNELEKVAEAFRALSNPKRLAIFQRLVRCCSFFSCSTEEEMTACVGQLGEGLGVAPSTVSHHIKELRYAGLIRVEKRGKEVHCRVEGEALADLVEFFNSLNRQTASSADGDSSCKTSK